MYCLHLLHLETGIPDRDYRHPVGWCELQATYVALLPRCALYHGAVIDNEPLAYPFNTEGLRGI